MIYIDTKKCYICKFDASTGQATGSQANRTLHWHQDPESNNVWVWCNGKCQKGYSLYEYLKQTGLSFDDIFENKPIFEEAVPNQVNRMEWPKQFIPLYRKEAAPAIAYLKSRNINPTNDVFYDTIDNGIVFPYHFQSTLCGAQVRFINPTTSHKITTVPGTRLALLFYNFNQATLPSHVKALVVTEGAFDTLSLQQAIESIYDVGVCPYRVCAISGSNISAHQKETLLELVESGIKVIAAPDSDQAGYSMLEKMMPISTHLAVTQDASEDWNKAHVRIKDDKDMAEFFFSKVEKI